jgi:hypothetical protein
MSTNRFLEHAKLTTFVRAVGERGGAHLERRAEWGCRPRLLRHGTAPYRFNYVAYIRVAIFEGYALQKKD